MNKEISVNCPFCTKKFSYYSSEFRPFCTEKCQKRDLGAWLTEGYVVPSNSPLNDEDIEKVIQSHEDEN